MDREERALFAKGIRHATATASGADLDVALDALGWRDALRLDEPATVATLFEHQGAAGATSSALDAVVAAVLGDGLGDTAIVLPAPGAVRPPGTVEGDGLRVHGMGTAALPGCSRALVVSEVGAHLVDTAALGTRAIAGMDPAAGWIEVTGTDVAPMERVPVGAWTDAIAAGQRALAHELVGASRAMLALAREHAVERIQFGRPIAGFQAVRHRLAEALVAVEAADAAAGAAWDDGSPLGAALAKAIAGRSSRTVARHSQQVLAGIGFTSEHPLHRYVRRVLVLDRLLGDARSLTAALGEDLLADRRLPSLLPL